MLTAPDPKAMSAALAQPVVALPTPRRIDLATLVDVRQEMARVYRGMKSGRLASQDGTRLCYVLSQIGKLIIEGDLDARVEALEKLSRGPAYARP